MSDDDLCALEAVKNAASLGLRYGLLPMPEQVAAAVERVTAIILRETERMKEGRR